jgi:hypothetical protein
VTAVSVLMSDGSAFAGTLTRSRQTSIPRWTRQLCRRPHYPTGMRCSG